MLSCHWRIRSHYCKAKLPKRTAKAKFSERLKLSIDKLLADIDETSLQLEAKHRHRLANLPSIQRPSSDDLNPDLKGFTGKHVSIVRRHKREEVYNRMRRDLHRIATEVCLMGE
jgi:hypothetical protein